MARIRKKCCFHSSFPSRSMLICLVPTPRIAPLQRLGTGEVKSDAAVKKLISTNETTPAHALKCRGYSDYSRLSHSKSTEGLPLTKKGLAAQTPSGQRRSKKCKSRCCSLRRKSNCNVVQTFKVSCSQAPAEWRLDTDGKFCCMRWMHPLGHTGCFLFFFLTMAFFAKLSVAVRQGAAMCAPCISS